MKSHQAFTKSQVKEINSRITAACKEGAKVGEEQAILFSLIALHDLYGWSGKTLVKFLGEITATARATETDPDMIDRIRLKIKGLGVEVDGQFTPRLNLFGGVANDT